jgi:hypothetical protein
VRQLQRDAVHTRKVRRHAGRRAVGAVKRRLDGGARRHAADLPAAAVVRGLDRLPLELACHHARVLLVQLQRARVALPQLVRDEIDEVARRVHGRRGDVELQHRPRVGLHNRLAVAHPQVGVAEAVVAAERLLHRRLLRVKVRLADHTADAGVVVLQHNVEHVHERPRVARLVSIADEPGDAAELVGCDLAQRHRPFVRRAPVQRQRHARHLL